MILNEDYRRETFLEFLDGLLPSFSKDIRPTSHNKYFKESNSLGSCDLLDLQVLELSLNGSLEKRVSITTEAFKLMKAIGSYKALVVFKSKESWRLSLMSATPTIEKAKVVTKLSNPRRFSYLLGPGSKTVTPYKYLIKQGQIKDFEDLQQRFSVEIVNKEFYESISELYTKLVGGKRKRGLQVIDFPGLLKIHGKDNSSSEHQEFAVRLIGRIVFCWFLREKKSANGTPLIPDEVLSLASFTSNKMNYHQILEPLFFEILNKKLEKREEPYREEPFSLIPYLNGGLFSPQHDDYYKYSNALRGGQPGVVDVPDEWLLEFIQLLNTYNFTVDENTTFDVDLSVDPEMLGRIFENLLAEINPETGESARKSTGSYYTPRTIVEFMVDKTLCNYLELRTTIDSKKIKALISYDLSDDEDYPLTKSEKDSIVDTLSKLTILDPACGSGAFPIGVLQKVVFMLQKIDSEAKGWLAKQISQVTPELRRHLEAQYENKNYDYLRKLGIIRESIYGIDIQPIATEIARLRCFLTLIVEESVDDKKYNRGVEPLPNLDFKFVSANSLGKLPDFANKQQQMFEDTENINALREIRNQYFGAAYEERAELQVAFKTIQHKMVLKNLDEYKGSASELSNALARWQPFENEPVEWFDHEWMFGIDEGFDVVIANPPYVRQEEITSQKLTLKKNFESYNGRADLFVYFYELGVNVLKRNGILTFISSNKWLRAKYGGPLRHFLSTNCFPRTIIDFGELPVFSAGTFPMIYIGQKNDGDICHFAQVKSLEPPYPDIEQVLKSNGQYISSEQLGADTWSFMNEKELAVIKKMLYSTSRIQPELIMAGIKTGLNSAFWLDKNAKDALIRESDQCKRFILPLLVGDDIRAWRTKTVSKWIIYTPVGTDIDALGPLRDHLNNWKERLENRALNQAWFELQQAQQRYCKLFNNPKIVYPDIAKESRFTLDEQGRYIDMTAFAVASSDKCLLAVLNSQAAWFFLKRTANVLGDADKGGRLRLKRQYLEKLPIPVIPSSERELLESLVIKILKAKQQNATSNVEHLEQEINKIVNNLYGLNEKESELIESHG